MLSQEQFSACIDALIHLGVVKKVETDSSDEELLRLSVPFEHIISRMVAAGYDQPPEGVDAVPWFACVMVKVLLDEKGIVVSKDELAGMASVVMGFISESSVMNTLQSRLNRPVIAPRRREDNRK